MDYDQKLYVIITEKYPVLYESIKLWRLQMLLLFNKKKLKKKNLKKKNYWVLIKTNYDVIWNMIFSTNHTFEIILS